MNSEDAFSTYDVNGNGSLDKDEMDTFMKENALPPPSGAGRMQEAISAYTAGTGSSQQTTSSLLTELLNQTSASSTSMSNTTDLQSQYISELIESLKSYGSSGQYTYSPVNITD